MDIKLNNNLFLIYLRKDKNEGMYLPYKNTWQDGKFQPSRINNYLVYKWSHHLKDISIESKDIRIVTFSKNNWLS